MFVYNIEMAWFSPFSSYFLRASASASAPNPGCEDFYQKGTTQTVSYCKKEVGFTEIDRFSISYMPAQGPKNDFDLVGGTIHAFKIVTWERREIYLGFHFGVRNAPTVICQYKSKDNRWITVILSEFFEKTTTEVSELNTTCENAILSIRLLAFDLFNNILPQYNIKWSGLSRNYILKKLAHPLHMLQNAHPQYRHIEIGHSNITTDHAYDEREEGGLTRLSFKEQHKNDIFSIALDRKKIMDEKVDEIENALVGGSKTRRRKNQKRKTSKKNKRRSLYK